MLHGRACGEPNQTRCFAVSGLVLHCLSMSHKKAASPAKVSSYLPFDKIANRNPWYDKMQKGR